MPREKVVKLASPPQERGRASPLLSYPLPSGLREGPGEGVRSIDRGSGPRSRRRKLHGSGRSRPRSPGRPAPDRRRCCRHRRRHCRGSARRVGALRPEIHWLPPAREIPPETGFTDREQRSSAGSSVFQRLALSELYQASREFPLKPASAERCQLAPFSDLGVGPAAAQAPPRLRIGTADVDAGGLRAFCPPFHGRAPIGVSPFALTMEPASGRGRFDRRSRSRCRERDAVHPPTRRARSRRPRRVA